MDKRIVYFGIFVFIAGSVGYVWYRHKKNLPVAIPTSDLPVIPTAESYTPAPSIVAPNATVVPQNNAGTSNKPNIVNATTPVVPTVTADFLLNSKGENAIIKKILFAKSNSAGIYDTTLKKVGITKAGQQLGQAFKAIKQSNGTYMIKYTDAAGNFRIVNSASVNVN